VSEAIRRALVDVVRLRRREQMRRESMEAWRSEQDLAESLAVRREIERLGDLVGHVSRSELDDISNALRLAFELD